MSDTQAQPALRDDRFEQVIKRLSEDAPALQAFRRAVRDEPGAAPALWSYVWTADARRSDDVAADHHALVLFAYHQQSKVDNDRAIVHLAGAGSIGTATRRLGDQVLKSGKVRADAPVTRRLVSAATASSLSELTWHLRGVVTLLRGQQIRLDYVQLRRDLRQWMWPDGAAKVRRRWGRDFYLTRSDRTAADPLGQETTHDQEDK